MKQKNEFSVKYVIEVGQYNGQFIFLGSILEDDIPVKGVISCGLDTETALKDIVELHAVSLRLRKEKLENDELISKFLKTIENLAKYVVEPTFKSLSEFESTT